MEPTKISLTLCKKDAILKHWKSRVMLEGNGILSFLVKQAIIAFITKNEFVEIGRVYMNPVNDTVEDYGKINVSIADEPIIQTWITSLIQNKIKPSDAIKTILQKSIKTVESSQEEYIPTYGNFSSNVMIEQLKKISLSIRSSEEEKVETPNTKDDEISEISKPISNVNEVKVETPNTKDDKIIEVSKPISKENEVLSTTSINIPIDNATSNTPNSEKKSLTRAWGLGPKR